ncbi:hypothetical protein Tco_0664142 [Tanacetum coccineum]
MTMIPTTKDDYDDKKKGWFSGFWKIHGSRLWKNKAMLTISIDGFQSSLLNWETYLAYEQTSILLHDP